MIGTFYFPPRRRRTPTTSANPVELAPKSNVGSCSPWRFVADGPVETRGRGLGPRPRRARVAAAITSCQRQEPTEILATTTQIDNPRHRDSNLRGNMPPIKTPLWSNPNHPRAGPPVSSRPVRRKCEIGTPLQRASDPIRASTSHADMWKTALPTGLSMSFVGISSALLRLRLFYF